MGEILAACHVHSDWSYDGMWRLEDLAARFIRRRCRVLMMTEHDRGFSATRLLEYRDACARASSAKILLVPGIEYSDAANRVHVLTWGQVPFLGEGLPTADMLKAVKAANGIAVLGHPTRKDAWKSYQQSWGSQLAGIELWNRKYDGWAPSRTARPLLSSSGAMPFVGLDFHTWRQSFPLAMALDIDGAISEEAVLACLRSRRCAPHAFGFPLGRGLVRYAAPPLKIAEQGRRIAASALRRSKVFAP